MCTLEQSPHINNYEYEPREKKKVFLYLWDIFLFY